MVNHPRGLLRALIASFGLASFTEAATYGHPMQVQPAPEFALGKHNTGKRKTPVRGKNGGHKRNLRASKRGGKQYKQVKA